MAQMPPSHWEAYTQRCVVPKKGSNEKLMTAVGFEPTQLALVELESTPLDHSGKLSSGASLKQRCLQFSLHAWPTDAFIRQLDINIVA